MIATLFYRNPRLTLLAVGLILVAGLAAFDALPRLEDPVITSRYALIQTDYPGASAEQVDAQVTEKIEAALFEIEEIQEIQSVSRTGFSELVVILEDAIEAGALDEIWSRVRDKLTDVTPSLPTEAGAPFFQREYPGAHTFVAAFIWNQDTPPNRGILTRLAKDFERKLRLQAGTLRTDLYGMAQEEITVRFEPATIAAAGLTPAAIARAVADADVKAPAGRLTTSDTVLSIEVQGPLDQVERVRRVPLKPLADGRILRVGDIADVTKSESRPIETLALVEGRQAVLVAGMMSGTWRADYWAADVRALFTESARDLPAGISARVLFDQSAYVSARLGDLAENLILALVLVVLVVCLTMGWRSGLVVGSILPLTMALVIAMLHVLGVALHQVSVSGLIIALGLLIDNAIVTVDEFRRRRERGLLTADAIALTVRTLFVPLLASSVTTILTFAPIALFPGPTGEFVGGLGTSVILSVAASLLLALTVIPALAGYLDRSDRKTPRASSGSIAATLGAPLHWLLRVVVCRPRLMAMIAMAPAIAGFVLSSQLVQQFFPPTDRDQFQMLVSLRTEASLEETEQVVRRIRGLLAKEPTVVADTWVLGESSPRVFYNVKTASDRVPSAANAFINTVSAAETRDLLPRLQAELIAAVPEAEVLVLPFEQGPLYDAPVEIELYGPDLETLRTLGDQIRLILSRSVRVTYTRATIASGQPQLVFTADEDAARLAGLALTDLAGTLADNLDGIVGGSIIEDTEELPVRIRATDDVRASVAWIASLPVTTASATGESRPPLGVPLDALGALTLRPTYGAITRYQGERVNRIQAFIDPFALPEETLADFRQRLEKADLRIPPGYRIAFAGESKESSESQAGLLAMVGPLAVLMIATVVLAFNSFRMAAIIALVAVLSMGMALFAVWVLQRPLGFMTILGGLGLVGIAINDSIVVLSALRADARARAGDADAICTVVAGCSRHVFSTTLTTIAGFVPLILWGSTFWQPLAIAIAGGVSGATMLALILVPALFAQIVRSRRPASGVNGSAAPLV